MSVILDHLRKWIQWLRREEKSFTYTDSPQFAGVHRIVTDDGLKDVPKSSAKQFMRYYTSTSEERQTTRSSRRSCRRYSRKKKDLSKFGSVRSYISSIETGGEEMVDMNEDVPPFNAIDGRLLEEMSLMYESRTTEGNGSSMEAREQSEEEDVEEEEVGTAYPAQDPVISFVEGTGQYVTVSRCSSDCSCVSHYNDDGKEAFDPFTGIYAVQNIDYQLVSSDEHPSTQRGKGFS